MNAGALQPVAVRQGATPRPCLPPNTNAAFIRFGTTAMHFAFSKTSCGIPWSGADMISPSTRPAFVRRSVASSRPFANAIVPIDKTTASMSSFFIKTASTAVSVAIRRRFPGSVVHLQGHEPALRLRYRSLDPAQQDQDDHDHQHQSQSAAGE